MSASNKHEALEHNTNQRYEDYLNIANFMQHTRTKMYRHKHAKPIFWFQV